MKLAWANHNAMKNAKNLMICCKKIRTKALCLGSTQLTRPDYLKVVKDYLEYEMVQAGFERNEQPKKKWTKPAQRQNS